MMKEKKKSLKNYVEIKDTVGFLLWFLLAGLFTVSISSNYVNLVDCDA